MKSACRECFKRKKVDKMLGVSFNKAIFVT
jgi:hypothetical protein